MHCETLKKNQYNFYVTNIFKYKSVYILNIHFIASLSTGDVTEAISHRKLASVRGFEALSLLEFHLRFFCSHKNFKVLYVPRESRSPTNKIPAPRDTIK